MLQKLEDIDAETDAMRHELYAQWNSVARKDSDNSSSDLDYRIQAGCYKKISNLLCKLQIYSFLQKKS